MGGMGTHSHVDCRVRRGPGDIDSLESIARPAEEAETHSAKIEGDASNQRTRAQAA
jgi:hypothetical protein